MSEQTECATPRTRGNRIVLTPRGVAAQMGDELDKLVNANRMIRAIQNDYEEHLSEDLVASMCAGAHELIDSAFKGLIDLRQDLHDHCDKPQRPARTLVHLDFLSKEARDTMTTHDGISKIEIPTEEWKANPTLYVGVMQGTIIGIDGMSYEVLSVKGNDVFFTVKFRDLF